MAAFGAERWLNDLPNHTIFKKIREKLDSEHNTNESGVAKNLTFCLGGDFFLWDDADRVFYTTNLRQLNSDESRSSGNYQTSHHIWACLWSPPSPPPPLVPLRSPQ
uniref:Uncharacterized protein n=1 Tax=Seriola lalandi dorsalis TaxID=1841481 RepID=A0A3B4WS50_SERLL